MKTMLRTADINAIVDGITKALLQHQKHLLNLSQVAEMLGKSREAVKKMCQRNQLPAHKHQRTYYFDEQELNEFLLK